MKKVGIILALVLVLAGAAMGVMSPAVQAQVYAPGPPQAVMVPYVGANTPWVFFRGDWFLNGVLYNFFGNKFGWAPYYAYAPTYIVRPTYWYAPKWNTWYQAHPTYWTNFQRQYPYWRGHQPGQHYDQNFYNKHHHGQGGGWQKGYHAEAYHPRPPAGRNYQPGTTGPGRGPLPQGQPGQFQPAPAQRQPAQYQRQPGQFQPGPAQKQPGQYHPGHPTAKQPGSGREAPQPQHRKPPEEPSAVR
jgi:hypothetical protein